MLNVVVHVTINNYSTLMIPLDTNYSIPTRKSSSDRVPLAHQPSLFLIQDGIWNKIINN